MQKGGCALWFIGSQRRPARLTSRRLNCCQPDRTKFKIYDVLSSTRKRTTMRIMTPQAISNEAHLPGGKP